MNNTEKHTCTNVGDTDTQPVTDAKTTRMGGALRDCLVHHKGRWVWVTAHVARLVAWDRMHQCDQKGQVWKQRRQHMLTASAIATAIDQNPYETRDNLIKQYAGVGKPSFNGNVATRHGEQYEDDAVELFEKQTGKTVLTFGLMPFFGRQYMYLSLIHI